MTADDEMHAVREWYLAHQSLFIRPEQRLTHHILLTFDDDREEIFNAISDLHQQLLVSPATFPGLALRHSHCPSALENGRLGWVSRGLLYPALDAALFALNAGQLSAPIETELGWHLLWCEAIRSPEPMPEADALGKARAYLLHRHSHQ